MEYFNPFVQRSLHRFSAHSLPYLNLTTRSILWLRRFCLGWPGGESLRSCPALPGNDWLHRLVQERSATSKISGRLFFSVKLQAHQLGRFNTALRRVFAPLAHQGLFEPFSQTPPKLLLLFRRNLARAVASFHLSLCSGCFDQGRIFSYQHRSFLRLGEPQPLLNDLAAYRIHLEWLVDALITCRFPIHRLVFEDLLSNQDEQLSALLHSIDPMENKQTQMNPAEILDFRIVRDVSSEETIWNQERQQWLDHLEDRIHQLRLLDHPEGLRAQELLHTLSAAGHSFGC